MRATGLPKPAGLKELTIETASFLCEFDELVEGLVGGLEHEHSGVEAVRPADVRRR